MIKRLFSFLLSFVILISIASAQTIDLKKMSDDDLVALQEAISVELAERHSNSINGMVLCDDDELFLVLKRAILLRDYGNVLVKDLVVFEFEWTNRCKDEKRIGSLANFSVYQDDIKLSYSVSANYDYPSDILKEIRTGKSITCYYAYELIDRKNDIELVFDKANDYYDQYDDVTVTIKYNELSVPGSEIEGTWKVLKIESDDTDLSLVQTMLDNGEIVWSFAFNNGLCHVKLSYLYEESQEYDISYSVNGNTIVIDGGQATYYFSDDKLIIDEVTDILTLIRDE